MIECTKEFNECICTFSIRLGYSIYLWVDGEETEAHMYMYSYAYISLGKSIGEHRVKWTGTQLPIELYWVIYYIGHKVYFPFQNDSIS